MALSAKQGDTLIASLLHAEVYPHPVDKLDVIETHISWVILTGPYAYKIKKPLNLGFLDFSSLEKRHQFCIEELRLNKRTAPFIYLEVIGIHGSATQPRLDGKGAVIEYAVKMRQFDQGAQLDRILKKDGLSSQHMDAFAHMVASFHEQVTIADQSVSYGNPESVLQPIEENFIQIREHIHSAEIVTMLTEMEQWSLSEYNRLKPQLRMRKQHGFIRECHGDMHLRNLAWIDNHPVAFDCIEFNPNLRWIDVISEVAFLVMDLQSRQQGQLAQRFINHYLEVSGDYQGISLLRLYLVYRAMVRAKVAAIRLSQGDLNNKERETITQEVFNYLNLAKTYMSHKSATLIITRGFSGSGKSTLTQSLLERLGAFRIRSDVERKRLVGLVSNESAAATPGSGIYSHTNSDRVYRYLLEQGASILAAGYPVIIDATFLKKEKRDAFRQLAEKCGVAFRILNFTAPAEVLQQRIKQRKGDASDADLAVLHQQIISDQPLELDEIPYVIHIDTTVEKDVDMTHFAFITKQ